MLVLAPERPLAAAVKPHPRTAGFGSSRTPRLELETERKTAIGVAAVAVLTSAPTLRPPRHFLRECGLHLPQQQPQQLEQQEREQQQHSSNWRGSLFIHATSGNHARDKAQGRCAHLFPSLLFPFLSLLIYLY